VTHSRQTLPFKKRRRWTAVELELLRRNYADSRTAELATALDRKVEHVYAKANALGLVKSDAYLASADACRLRRGDNLGAAHRFAKGHVPANKGLRRPGFAPGNMKKTQFKKGQMPHTWKPIGSYRINADGVVEFKFSEEPGAYTKRWIPVHRKVWIEANGPVPAGHVVAFRPGRRTTDPALITLDAIELITKVENMRRNTLHTIYPPELVKVTQLRGALTRRINRRAREEEPS
jgi:hypothetical protein